MKDINSSFKWKWLTYDSYLYKCRIKSFFSKVSMIEQNSHSRTHILNIKFNSFISNTFLYFSTPLLLKKKQPMADSCSCLTEKNKILYGNHPSIKKYINLKNTLFFKKAI